MKEIAVLAAAIILALLTRWQANKWEDDIDL